MTFSICFLVKNTLAKNVFVHLLTDYACVINYVVLSNILIETIYLRSRSVDGARSKNH